MDVIGKLGGLIEQAEQKAVGIVEKYLPPPVAGSHLTPQALLKINGREFGTETQSRILGISLTDKRGFEADELTIELSDHDGARWPSPTSATKSNCGWASKKAGWFTRANTCLPSSPTAAAPTPCRLPRAPPI